MKTEDFGPIKRKVYLAYHQDGILDLTAGMVVLGFGTFMLVDNVIFLVVGSLAALQYIFWKNRITIPRYGFVRVNSQEKSTLQGILLMGLGVLVLFAFLILNYFSPGKMASPEFEAWSQRYHMVPLSAVLFGLPALGAAVFLGLKRFYLYALLAVVLPALGGWIDLPTYAPILSLGMIILVTGGVLLVRFLKTYPLDRENRGDVS
jgi:hypothetical protein